MALAKTMVRLFVALAAVAQTGYGLEKKISLEHLSNGLTYCLTQEEVLEGKLSIQLVIKFEDTELSVKEQLLARCIQEYITEALYSASTNASLLNIQQRLIIEQPQVYSHPHITVYRMSLENPSQGDLDGMLCALSHTLDSLSFTCLCDPEATHLSFDYLNSDATSLTAQDLKEFASQYYRFEKMILMIAGNVAEYDVSESIRQHFSTMYSTKFAYPVFKKEAVRLVAANYNPEQNRWLISPYKVEDPRYNSFDEIPLHEKEEKVIEKLMHCLASSSVPKLIWKQNDLQKLGRSINHVHPLKFISHIINQPILRSDLQEVHRNYFKWKGFLDGFRKRMTEEFYKGTLKDLIPGFAQSVDVKPEIVEHFVERRDWEGLVKSILY